ncbi:MAG: TIGR02678 family protein [Micropruina sp.]|uniref:TIGR02678 family protein n=1 Tax=Micropruina sp. TaxID=2737536 RepID=UPI0039E60CE4
MSTLQNQLAVQEREDVARAVRGLLRTPWVTQASDPALYELVRRRRLAVVKWFEHYLGWELLVQTDAGYVRLAKQPGDRVASDDLRPARRQRSSKAPFDRLRYVLLCVVAAELLDARLITIGDLAERVTAACAADEGLPRFQTDRHEHRRAFVDVLIALESWGAVVRIDGQTEVFADDAAVAVLYRVHPPAVHHLVACPQGPSLVAADDLTVAETIEALTDEPGYGPDHRNSARQPASEGDPARPSSVQRSLWARHSVLRRLFDDAVVHLDELTVAERDYVRSITGRKILRQAAELSGFALEERAEGFLLVDPDRVSGPDAFPSSGAASAAALHLITHLLTTGDTGATTDELTAQLAALMDDAPTWARSYRDDAGPQRLADEAIGLLAGHHLVHRADGRVVARPAAARYRAATLTRRPARRTTAPAAEPAQDDLFAIEEAS